MYGQAFTKILIIAHKCYWCYLRIVCQDESTDLQSDISIHLLVDYNGEGHQLQGKGVLLSPHLHWLASYGCDGVLLLRTTDDMVSPVKSVSVFVCVVCDMVVMGSCCYAPQTIWLALWNLSQCLSVSCVIWLWWCHAAARHRRYG